MNIDKRFDEILTAIEDIELLSLRWGDVNGSLNRDDLKKVVEQLDVGNNADDTIENLIDAALIRAFDVSGGEERFRTRFTETMRLLTQTRQIFRGESWRGAPQLVADFKVDLRPRRYPKRDRDSEVALNTFVELSEVQREVWHAITPSMLSTFQVDATSHLLRKFTSDNGTIITTGTGSGKTLAFYLPVLLCLVENAKSKKFWTAVIAIYPRKELLKDQLTEAYRNVCRINSVLNRPGYRPIRVGAYFGDTPKFASERNLSNWQKSPLDASALICPFLRCHCNGDLIWTMKDINEGRERLHCASDCGHVFDEQILPLTRKSIQQFPPDILFTTNEMLNRSLADQFSRHVFGLKMPKARRPKFLLLDEAHTYNGIAGAQTALTLRRWRALAGGPVCWVGLSATLEGAQDFFADLTGLPPQQVSELTPDDSDMLNQGREYQVALRGDPTSRTALLSTSIQASMLLARVMDSEKCLSQGRYGTRLFAFTDDLDVTHRLYDNLKDAEGYNIFGEYQPTIGTLATLRSSVRQDSDTYEREQAGQIWRLPETIGHNLSDPLVIARTTSRDPGVNRQANVTVATSALEVGFNDSTVGAILQHKAPRNFASFLQRRGRAGRTRQMRPITVTVLSDYGRDRQLFQSFEHLFEPRIGAQSLPIWNQYVLRMQAAFALLDWIADCPLPEGVQKGHVWRTASAPSNSSDKKFRKHIQKILSLLISGEQEILDNFTNYLCSALNIGRETANRILWEPPRSILLEVAPTLLRRIYRNWRLARPSTSAQAHEMYIFNHPLPEFVPQTLFSDLNLPEVAIVLPAATRNDQEIIEHLPVQQALTQLAPGRVSRRYGDAYGDLAHWYPVPSETTECSLLIDEFAEVNQFIGEFTGEGKEGRVFLPVYRPWRVKLEKISRWKVSPTSISSLVWSSGFVDAGNSVSICPPSRTVWHDIVEDLQLYLHQFDSCVSVRRFASGAKAQINRPGAGEQIVDINFVDASGHASAVGYEFETDGLALTLDLSSQKEFTFFTFEPTLERAIRSLLFKHLSTEDSELPREMNIFQREWVCQIFLLATVRRAIETCQNLADAADAMASETDTTHFEETIDAVIGVKHNFETLNGENSGLNEVETNSETRSDRNRHENLVSILRTLLADQSVRKRMSYVLQTSLSSDSAEREMFLRKTLESTVADALLTAVISSAPQHLATDSLVADIARDSDEADKVTIWITETTVGGTGILQAISSQFAREPRSLFLSLEAALEPSDLESASEALRQTYGLLDSDDEVTQLIDSVRDEPSHEGRETKRNELLDVLTERGVEITRTFVVSLNSRIITPGARKPHDDTVKALLELWETIEDVLEIELTAREIAALGAFDDTVCSAGINAHLFDSASGLGERAKILSGLLWPKTDELRRESLASWTPFRNLTTPIPQLVRAYLLESDCITVTLEGDNWKDALVVALSSDGTAKLKVPATMHGKLKQAILEITVNPVTVGHLQFYPTLERISKELIDESGKHFIAHFVLKEQV